jgi:hypothetical protein
VHHKWGGVFVTPHNFSNINSRFTLSTLSRECGPLKWTSMKIVNADSIDPTHVFFAGGVRPSPVPMARAAILGIIMRLPL